jgi:magnesium transporter
MFRKQHPPVGARPGTLVVPKHSPPPRIRAISYTPDEVRERDLAGPDEIKDLLGEETVWIDVQGLGDEATLRRIGEIFSLHPLALEDVVNVPQRPVTEGYDDHQLYISRMVTRQEDGRFEMEQVSVFLGRTFVLTFQEQYGDVLDPVRERIRQGRGPMRKSGPDYLAYAIIDAIIDYYYPALESISEQIEALEQEVMDSPTNETLAEVNRIKRVLLELRRGIGPQRDAVAALVRGDSDFVSEPVRLFLRDCYEHCVQLNDVIETHRELASSLLNTYMSSISNRTNEVMKVLTIMASIFIPLTFLAGIYGMNFEVMPELHVKWAYPAVLATMVLTAGGMLLYFRRLGWIGGRDRRDG